MRVKVSAPSWRNRGGVCRRPPPASWRAAALACALAATLAACQTTAIDATPPVAVPAGFSTTGTAALPDKWWQSFDDPVLDELVGQALDGNLSIRGAWDRLVQAEATARKAGAALLPGVDGSASASGTRQKAANSAGRRVVTSSSELSLGLTGSYEVDLWGGIHSTRDAAALDAKASEEDLKTAAVTLSANVAETWYELVEKYGQAELLRSQMETNEKVLDVVTEKFRQGQVLASDVLQQREQVEATRGSLVLAESQAKVLEHALAVLLGKAPNAIDIPQVDALVTLPELPATGVPADLVRRRPDLRKAYFEVLAADRRVAAAIADRFPSLTLSAKVTTSGDAMRDLFSNWLGTLAAGLAAPLFDAGERKAEVERTRAVTSEALNAYGETVLSALNEVEDALTQEASQRRYLASLERQLDLSEQAFQRIRDTYISGGADFVKVLDALLTSQGLERTRLEAQRQLVAYRIALCRALGGGWEMTRPAGAGTVSRSEGTDHPQDSANPRRGG